MRQTSVQAQYPHLFGQRAEAARPLDMKPADLRLLQWCMRQAAKWRQPAPRRRTSSAVQAAPAR